MKIFVSGQIDEKEKIRDTYSRLRQEGFEITHDWTQTDDLKLKEKFSSEAGLRASKDIAGVCSADIYIIVTNNSKCGKGMYAELGAALALVQIGKKLDIYVIGPKNHPTIFYSHPAARYFESLDDCILDIKRLADDSMARLPPFARFRSVLNLTHFVPLTDVLGAFLARRKRNPASNEAG